MRPSGGVRAILLGEVAPKRKSPRLPLDRRDGRGYLSLACCKRLLSDANRRRTRTVSLDTVCTKHMSTRTDTDSDARS
eukprot:scaffold37576_cov72-Phaeocystis_antarctica.AAC.3